MVGDVYRLSQLKRGKIVDTPKNVGQNKWGWWVLGTVRQWNYRSGTIGAVVVWWCLPWCL